MKIDILGTDYDVIVDNNNPKLKDADGICEIYSKKLIITTNYANDPDCFENIDEYIHKVLRHEAFHALFAEMGIKEWFNDEELVDMLAMQYPKIKNIMDKCDEINIYSLNEPQTERNE